MDPFLLQHCIYCHNKGVIVQCQAVTVRKCGSTESRFILSLFLLFFFFAGICPSPIKNRDVVTLRSWQVMDDEYIIVNFSVRHPVRHLVTPPPPTPTPHTHTQKPLS